ncbi:hypothetical protein [Xenorhabdus sp. SGI246]|uniref:hypothetical protein n=1 Tax=Xenorhabdus sp. SGI246 TaxID=3158263 RepID=UPI00349FCC4E
MILSLACSMVAELMTNDHSAKFTAQSSAEILADGYTKNFSHPSNSLFIPFILTLARQSAKFFAQSYLHNSLINIQTPDLVFGHSLGSPIISDQLLNPLIFNQAANMQYGHNLTIENIGMQTGDYLCR